MIKYFYLCFVKTAVCHKTGKTAKLCMERYCEMSGCYKPVSYSGTKEMCAAMGKILVY